MCYMMEFELELSIDNDSNIKKLFLIRILGSLLLHIITENLSLTIQLEKNLDGYIIHFAKN